MTRRLSPDERRLWSKVARTVRPAPGKFIENEEDPGETLSGPMHVAPPGPAKPPPARRAGPPEDLSGQRRIRRGQHVIEARLDLHGHTQDSARRELQLFLSRQAAQGARCVLVITGKGRLGAGVLRARLSDWIADPDLRPLIAGFAQAHMRHGGAGAVYVFLRPKARAMS
jgi:DNA-nicking Smr family endonuclease